MSLPKLNEYQILKCEGAITQSELLKALSSMDPKEFYIKCWDIKEPLRASIQQSFVVRELSTYPTSKCRYETNLDCTRWSLKKYYFYHS